MNSIVIKKNKKRVTDVYKIYLWLFYHPLGQLLSRREKDVLASYINLYLGTKKAFGTTDKQNALVYKYVFSTEACKLICSDLNIKNVNLAVITHKLKILGCILLDKDGNKYLENSLIPKIERTGDIRIETTIRFV